jgi:para-aminobenzoate synthetase component 1
LTTKLYHSRHLSESFYLGGVRAAFEESLAYWVSGFKVGCLLHGNHHGGKVDVLAAVSDREGLTIRENGHRPFEQLRHLVDNRRDWLFGFLSYDLKNDIESLSSEQPDGIGMPLLHFFEPEILVRLEGDFVHISSSYCSPLHIFQGVFTQKSNSPSSDPSIPAFVPCESKERYLNKIRTIREHIIAGDIYEMNYCTAFIAKDSELSPPALFNRLNALARAPFATFYKWSDRYLLCGSPERFVSKEGDWLVSQPIKGTAPRGKTHLEDIQNRVSLAQSEKDKAENVMIVDLVRNDLAKCCVPGTVEVEELFGIYGFERVWQMISTVRGELRKEIHPVEALRGLFPMGSMTGAPKVMAMHLIECYEEIRRGLYSGSVGYFSPDGNFDFNVVIRSLLYHATEGILSYHVGGAIVFDSDPEQEYEECLLKAEIIRQAVEYL